MAALTRLGCFILCPHLYGDCDLIVPSCRCLARRQRPNSAPRERALQDQMQGAEWATASMRAASGHLHARDRIGEDRVCSGGGREGLEWPSSDNRGSLIAAHSCETRPVCRTAKFGPVRACTPSNELRSAGWRLVRQAFRVG